MCEQLPESTRNWDSSLHCFQEIRDAIQAAISLLQDARVAKEAPLSAQTPMAHSAPELDAVTCDAASREC